MGSELVSVGRVGKPHGLDGGFFVEGASERADVFEEGATLYAGGEPATVVASRRGSGGRPVIRLDRHVERGSDLAVARATLPTLSDEEADQLAAGIPRLSRRMPLADSGITYQTCAELPRCRPGTGSCSGDSGERLLWCGAASPPSLRSFGPNVHWKAR